MLSVSAAEQEIRVPLIFHHEGGSVWIRQFRYHVLGYVDHILADVIMLSAPDDAHNFLSGVSAELFVSEVDILLALPNLQFLQLSPHDAFVKFSLHFFIAHSSNRFFFLFWRRTVDDFKESTFVTELHCVKIVKEGIEVRIKPLGLLNSAFHDI